MQVGELFAKLELDMSEFIKDLDSALRQFQNAGSKMKDIGATLTKTVTLPIIAVGTASAKFASDMNESINKVEVAFKDNAKQVESWSSTTLKSFGIAKGTSLDMAATFGDMATSMGLNTAQAADMSTSMVGLAGDLASFKNISIDIANTALTSVFTGETESLKQLGIVMTQANLQEYAYSQGIKKKIEDMSQAEQVQLRYNYVMAMTTNAQGDFVRTGAGAANQMRVFKESLKELGATIGQNILPVLTPVITKINEWIQQFAKLDPSTQRIILVVGAVAAAIGPVLLAIGSLSGAVLNTTAAFTKVKGVISAAGGVIGMLTSPIGIAVMAIGGLIAAGVLLYKNQDAVKNKIISAWASIKTTVLSCVDGLVGGIAVMFETFGLDTFAAKARKTQAELKSMLSMEADLKHRRGVAELFSGVSAAMTQSTNETQKATAAVNTLNIAMDNTGQKAADVANEVARGWETAAGQIESAMGSIASVVGSKSELNAQEYKNKIANILESLTDLQGKGVNTGPVAQALQAALQQVDETVMTGSKEAWTGLLDSLRSAMVLIGQTGSKEAAITADAMKVIYGRAVEAINASVEQAAEKALDQAQDAYDRTVQEAKYASDKETESFQKTYDQAKETYDGIVDQAKDAYDEIVEAAEQARDQKVSSYQDELDAIDQAETKRDREATRTKLQNKIKSARTAKDKAEAENEWDEWLHDEQIRIQKESIQDKIKAANTEYDDAKTAAERERDRQIAAAEDQLKIEEGKYNEGLRLAKQHYKDTLAEAQTYYKTLGYSIDEVTGKLTQQTAAAQAANAAVSGGKTSGQTTQTQTPTTQTPTGTTTPTGGTQADTWRPTVGTALRYESIPGVTITPSSDGNNWYFKFSSSKGTWNRLASTIPGTSLLNGSYTIIDSAAFYNFIKDLIPGYASGTGGHPGGPALIDEKENELVIEPGKKPYVYKEKGPKYVNLPKGTQVIPAYEEGTLPALTPEEQALVDTSDDELGYTQLKKKLRLIAQRTGKSSYWIQWRGMDQENYWTDTDEYIGTEPPSMFQLVYHSSLDGDGAGVESSKGMPGSHLLETEWEAFNQQIKEAYLKAGDVYTWRGEGDYTKIAASAPTPETATDTPSSEGDLIGDMQEGLSTTLGDIGNTRDKANAQIEADALTAQANNPTDKRREYMDKVSKATVELDYAQGQLDAINTAIAKATEKYGAESEEVKSFTHQQELATIAVQAANANLRIAQRELTAYDEQTGEWSDELGEANTKLTGINTSLANANSLYTAAKKAVEDASGVLSDYQSKLSDYGQTDITGTSAYDTAQHERDQATAAIDLQILEEETNKTKGYRKRIKALQKEKEKIETENQKAALEYELSIGDQQWQLQQLLSDAKEMNFTELTSAITQTRQQIATAQSTLATAQSNLTTAEDSVTFWQGLQTKQQNLISVLGTAYNTLAEKVSAFNTALNSVTTASLTSPGAATSIMSMVKLPMADAGGVALNPMLGIWAEKRPEALIPLDRLPSLIVDSLALTMGQRGGNLSAQGAGEVSMSFNFTGPINVRNDNDIKQVSREIFSLAQNSWRSRGVR